MIHITFVYFNRATWFITLKKTEFMVILNNIKVRLAKLGILFILMV